ncbi:MAG: hypothetical protein R2757_14275 [Draconibacterium sp.]|jgi:hypothetical protein
MKTVIYSLLFLTILLFVSCNEDEVAEINNSTELIGFWGNRVVNDTIYTFERLDSLKDNDYGFTFKTGEIFMERANTGWCGTPPVSYTNYNGTWSQNDSIINISVAYWGGMADYQWKIVHIDNNTLTINVKIQNYNNQ